MPLTRSRRSRMDFSSGSTDASYSLNEAWPDRSPERWHGKTPSLEAWLRWPEA